MAIAVKDKKSLQMWCTRLSYIVLGMCSLATGYAGWEFAEGHPLKTIVFVSLMGLMPWCAAWLLPFVSVARQSGRPFAAAGLAVICFGAIVAEWTGEVMVFAGQRQTTALTATMQDARYEDARKSVSTLERQLATMQETLEKQLSYGPSASYAGRITEAEQLAERESSKARNGCRAKCDAARKEAAELRAKQAIALDRESKTEPEVARLTAALAEAKAMAGSTNRGNSIAAASSGLIATLVTTSLSPNVDAKAWANIWLGVFLATVLTFLGIGLSFAGVTDWDAPKPARKATWLSNLIARIKAWLRGEQYEAPAAQYAVPAAQEAALPQPPAPKPVSIRTVSVDDVLRMAKAA